MCNEIRLLDNGDSFLIEVIMLRFGLVWLDAGLARVIGRKF